MSERNHGIRAKGITNYSIDPEVVDAYCEFYCPYRYTNTCTGCRFWIMSNASMIRNKVKEPDAEGNMSFVSPCRAIDIVAEYSKTTCNKYDDSKTRKIKGK